MYLAVGPGESGRYQTTDRKIMSANKSLASSGPPHDVAAVRGAPCERYILDPSIDPGPAYDMVRFLKGPQLYRAEYNSQTIHISMIQ